MGGAYPTTGSDIPGKLVLCCTRKLNEHEAKGENQ